MWDFLCIPPLPLCTPEALEFLIVWYSWCVRGIRWIYFRFCSLCCSLTLAWCCNWWHDVPSCGLKAPFWIFRLEGGLAWNLGDSLVTHCASLLSHWSWNTYLLDPNDGRHNNNNICYNDVGFHADGRNDLPAPPTQESSSHTSLRADAPCFQPLNFSGTCI